MSNPKTFIINTMSEDKYHKLSSTVSNRQLYIIDDNNPKNCTVIPSFDTLTHRVSEINKNIDKAIETFSEMIEEKSDLAIAYSQDDKKIFLKNGENIISEINADNFIKDGMLSSAIWDSENKIIKLAFNTDAGIQEISVDLFQTVTSIENDITSISAAVALSIDMISAHTALSVDEISTAIAISVDNIASDLNIMSSHIALSVDGISTHIALSVDNLKTDIDIMSSHIALSVDEISSIITTSVDNILNNMQISVNNIEKQISDISDAVAVSAEMLMNTKLDVDDETVVKFQKFTYGNDNIIRKTIQLDNYDSISGKLKNGGAANLAMVSKWDVADFGSSQIHANINTKDNVTVNDSEILLTNENLSSYLSVDGLSVQITNQNGKYVISVPGLADAETNSKTYTDDLIQEISSKIIDELSGISVVLSNGVNNLCGEIHNELLSISSWLSDQISTNYENTISTISDVSSTLCDKIEKCLTSVPKALTNEFGGIKIGYEETDNNNNYAVCLDENGRAYVNVPWTDENLCIESAYYDNEQKSLRLKFKDKDIDEISVNLESLIDVYTADNKTLTCENGEFSVISNKYVDLSDLNISADTWHSTCEIVSSLSSNWETVYSRTSALTGNLPADTIAYRTSDEFAEISDISDIIKIGENGKKLSACRDLSIIKINQIDYYRAAYNKKLNPNALYSLDISSLYAYGMPIKYVGDAVEDSDAVNFGQVKLSVNELLGKIDNQNDDSVITNISTILENKIVNKIKVGDYGQDLSAVNELSVVKIDADKYYKLAKDGQLDNTTLYILSNNNINAHSQRITYVGTPVQDSDAVNLSTLQQVSANINATANSMIPVSAFDSAWETLSNIADKTPSEIDPGEVRDAVVEIAKVIKNILKK